MTRRNTYATVDVYRELRREIDRYPSQAAAARDIGVSPSHLGDIIARRRDFGPVVLSWLGFDDVHQEKRYRKVGGGRRVAR